MANAAELSAFTISGKDGAQKIFLLHRVFMVKMAALRNHAGT
jgi:hypothetical protein